MKKSDSADQAENSGNYSGNTTGSQSNETLPSPVGLAHPTAVNAIATANLPGISSFISGPAKSTPVFTSRDTETFTSNLPGTFYVTVSGFPVPVIHCAGSLPSGISFLDNHNGTATLTGNPGGSGTFNLILTAKSAEGIAIQKFSLIVENY